MLRSELQEKDRAMLAAIAEFRITTVSQLSAKQDSSLQMVRRRCRRLVNNKLVIGTPRGLGGRRGRPEDIYSVTCKGVDLLKDTQVLSPEIPADRVTGDSLVKMLDHQLLLNSVAIQFEQLHEAHQDLDVTFISSSSPSHVGKAGGSLVSQKLTPPNGDPILFFPDAACSISNTETDKRLLFFVEVDMGTEPVVRRKGDQGEDVRTKLLTYRAFLGSRQYEGAQRLLGGPFQGFRLLLLAHTPARRQTLCRVVREMKQTEFIWVSDQTLMAEHGIGGATWYRGGNEGADRESILGGFAQP